MLQMFLIFLAAAFVNNYVLTQFLALCPFFGVSKKMETAVGMGLTVVFVGMVSSIFTYIFYIAALVPLGLEYLQVVAFILIISSTVQFVEVFMKKTLKNLYNLLGIFLPLVTTNCMVFGVVIINVRNDYTFMEMFFNSLGAGAGFLFAIIILASIREKLDSNSNIPELFRGMPLALFSAGLMSIAFMGFQGLI